MSNSFCRLTSAGLALVIFSLCAFASAHSLQEIQEKGRLRVAVYKELPPFSDNGKGIDVDIAAALAAKLGLKLELFWLQADENVEDDLRNAVWKGHYLGGGVADVMVHAPVDPEYAKRVEKVRLFGAYYRERLEVVRSIRRMPHIPNLQVFAQEKIGAEVDSISSQYLLSAFGGRLRNNVVHFKSAGEAVAAMKRGEVAAVMAPRAELEASVASELEEYAVTAVATPGLAISNWPLGMAVKAENAELAAALETEMEDLLKSGAVQAIFKKHGITYTPP